MDTIALDTTAIHSNGVIWIPWHWIPIDPPLEARLGEATHAPGRRVCAISGLGLFRGPREAGKWVCSARLRTSVRCAINTVIAQRTSLQKWPHRGGVLGAVCPVLGKLAEACPHAGRRYNPATAQQGTRADMGTPSTDREWHEPVQVPSAAGTITEIDTIQPADRAEFERLADEWLELRPRGVDVAQMIRHPAY